MHPNSPAVGSKRKTAAVARLLRDEAHDPAVHRAMPAGVRGAERLSVRRALRAYFTEHVAERVIAKDRQEYAIRHLEAFFGDTAIETIGVHGSRAYRDARREAGAADSTIRRELAVLSAAGKHCVRWGHALREPTVELPLVAQIDAPWLHVDEIDYAIAQATGRVHDFIVLGYYTAARRGALETLRKTQVNLAGRQIRLMPPDADALQQRSKKRRPVVPITDEMLPVVERLLETEGEYLLGDPTPLYHGFRSHMERIGFAGRAHPHILRHSRATHLLQRGVSVWHVAQLLGDTVQTVERTYGHHCPDTLRWAL
jgi:integrase